MSITRRAVLRGAGVAMALPWLESLPAAASTGAPKRLAVLFMGNGISGNHWWAAGSGEAMTLGRSLTPLAPFASKINVVNGLFNQPAVGKGIHPAQTGNLLSGAPLAEGGAIGASTTFDQILADRIGRETALASLALSCEAPRDGCHETRFSLAYSSHIAWRGGATPAACDACPAQAFDRLFSDGADRSGGPEGPPHTRRADGGSIIDRVLERVTQVRRSVSAGDRARLDAYLTNVRELEVRTAALKGCPTPGAVGQVFRPAMPPAAVGQAFGSAADGAGVGQAFRPAMPDAPDDDIRERARLMIDLVALAFQTDRTRIATLVLARDLSALRYPFLNVDGDHHAASHDDLSDGYERIVRFHVGQLAALAARLEAMPEGDGTVLDRSCLLWLSNMWSGWKHDNMKLPIVTVGTLGGSIATGRTLEYLYAGDEQRRLCSLYLSLMDRMGVALDRFGDADTRLAGF